jgi:micrococcal nuclease
MRKRLGLLSTAIIAAIVCVTAVFSPDKDVDYNGLQTAAADESVSSMEGRENRSEAEYNDSDASTGERGSNGSDSADGQSRAAEQTGAGPKAAGEHGDQVEEIDRSAYRENCPIKIPDTEGIAPNSYIEAAVSKVVDGDTIKVEYKGETYKVRLLCIDTPETVKSGVDEQPYGKEASNKLKELIDGKKVKLVFEKDTDDNYGRLLAYVMLDDGTCVNALMIAQGCGVVMIVSPNKNYKDYLNGLMQEAIDNKRGLWSLPEDERPFVLNDKGNYKARYIQKDAA